MDFLLPLAAYAFVSSITPGPNNLMLAASGVAFGLKRTLPHMFGVPAGFGLLLIVCAVGVGALFMKLPAASLALKVFGSVYLIYLTWTMRHAFGGEGDGRRARPLSFLEAFLFQFANPKGWIMGLTAASVFLPSQDREWTQIAAFTAVFIGVGIPCIWTWASFGAAARRLLANERWQRAFAVLIVALMAYTVIAIWI
jgi:threonine/homoserine/homoserine lactone efflux protein